MNQTVIKHLVHRSQRTYNFIKGIVITTGGISNTGKQFPSLILCRNNNDGLANIRMFLYDFAKYTIGSLRKRLESLQPTFYVARPILDLLRERAS